MIGRTSIIQKCIRYLLQHGYFYGGCFVIDCKYYQDINNNNNSNDNNTVTFHSIIKNIIEKYDCMLIDPVIFNIFTYGLLE